MVFSAKYEKRVVCFIDILGFSNIIKKTAKETTGVNISLQKIVNALNFIHFHFAELSFDYEGLIQLSQFSDSIVISFPLKNRSEMIVLFKNIKYVQVQLLSGYGILMRGGIVIGNVIHNESLLLGPAMIDAYMLESKCAMSPRIVIDPKVVWQYRKAVKECEKKGMFDNEPTFIKDLDDTYYIDYFNFYDVDFYLNGNPQKYYSEICEIVRDNVNSTDISIRVKYLWIRNKLKKCALYKNGIEYKQIYKRIITDRK